MIVGIGVDVVDLERFARSLDRTPALRPRLFGEAELVAPGGEPNPVLTAPANLAHGFLGWTLLVLIAGHVAMALYHGLVRRDGTLTRMTRGPDARSLPAE